MPEQMHNKPMNNANFVKLHFEEVVALLDMIENIDEDRPLTPIQEQCRARLELMKAAMLRSRERRAVSLSR